MDFNINTLRPLQGAGRKLFIETYGCQMNVGDTEIVVSLMQREGYVYTEQIGEADVILINTCSIRDNAEQRIWGRLAEMKRYRRQRPGLVVGVIGCMAERLREKLVEGPAGVDVVAGPDAYRDLPRLVRGAEAGGKGVNVLLSTEETYAEIAPVQMCIRDSGENHHRAVDQRADEIHAVQVGHVDVDENQVHLLPCEHLLCFQGVVVFCGEVQVGNFRDVVCQLTQSQRLIVDGDTFKH